MKAVIRQSMKEMLFKLLLEYNNDTTRKDNAVIEHYAESFVENFERYLKAYNEFKED